MDNAACTDVFHCLDADIRSSSPEDQAKKIDTIHSMINRRIHSTGMVPAMPQPHNNLRSLDEGFLDYVPEKPIAQPDNSFNRLSSFVAFTQASMRFSAILPLGGSTIARSSRPISCSNSKSNSNHITCITNVTNVEEMGLIDESTIV